MQFNEVEDKTMQDLTALFTNMRILKFKSQLTIAFFAANWWISICFVCFCVSRFIACDRNYD